MMRNLAAFAHKSLFYIPFMVIGLCVYGCGMIAKVVKALSVLRSTVSLCHALLLLVVEFPKKQSRDSRSKVGAFSIRLCKCLIMQAFSVCMGSNMESHTHPPLKAHIANHQAAPYVAQNFWAEFQFPKCEASA